MTGWVGYLTLTPVILPLATGKEREPYCLRSAKVGTTVCFLGYIMVAKRTIEYMYCVQMSIVNIDTTKTKETCLAQF